MGRNKFTKARQENLRTWIMFIFALALLSGMFIRKDQIGPYWTMMIGAMLGLSVIVSAVGGLMMNYRLKEKSDDEDSSDKGSRQQRFSERREAGKRAAEDPGMGQRRISLVRAFGWHHTATTELS